MQILIHSVVVVADADLSSSGSDRDLLGGITNSTVDHGTEAAYTEHLKGFCI